jgi:glucosamine--fructose-6-phosphate aminotransferase (isomerizing)
MVKMWEEIFQQPEVLKNCRDINRKTLIAVTELLRERNIGLVVVAARGSSDHAGIYGKYIIEYQLGIPVVLAAPSIYTIYRRRLSLQNCLVIGLSQSGMAADVLAVLKGAEAEGAVTLSITNAPDSPLAKGAAFHLHCNAGTEKSVAATKTFTSQMYILAELVVLWSGNRELASGLSEVPGGIAEILDAAGYIKEIGEGCKAVTDCFVLARGINYPIALETALKLQETSYVRAKAYASSDFYHGPFAMIEKETPVIVFAPEGPAKSSGVEMIKRLKDSGARLLVISNSKEVLEAGNEAIAIPATAEDIISPFYNIAAAQLFCCSLALAKGLDPDAPRGLKKVTVTL